MALISSVSWARRWTWTSLVRPRDRAVYYCRNAAAPKISKLFSLESSDLSGVSHFMNCLQIFQITADTEDYFAKMAKFTSKHCIPFNALFDRQVRF